MAKSASQKIIGCLVKVAMLVRSCLTLSIPTFFLWSGLVYIATAVVVAVMRPQVYAFLCNIHISPDKMKTCTASNIIMGQKTSCWAAAMNITVQTLAKKPGDDSYMDMEQASGDWHCLQAATEAESPVTMLRLLKSRAIDDGTNTGNILVTTKCVSWHCQVWKTAITHPDLVLAPLSDAQTGCSNTVDAKPAVDANNCLCYDLYGSMQEYGTENPPFTDSNNYIDENLCNFALPTTTVTTTTVVTACPDGTTGEACRRLGSNAAVTDAAPRLLDHMPVEQPDVSAEENDKLKEFTVGDWSRCTCYQACLPGIRTRSVQCQSPPCKTPMPVVSQDCECAPCAECSVMLNSLLVIASASAQGAFSLLVWLGIVYMNTIPENHLTNLSWSLWFLGIFIRRLPFLVRLFVLVNIGQAVFLVFQTFIPSDVIEFQPDCNDIPALRVMTIFFASVMVFQVALGMLAKYFNRMYPYLFRPIRDGSFPPLKLFKKLLRSLGP
jgi:hypothetical protein